MAQLSKIPDTFEVYKHGENLKVLAFWASQALICPVIISDYFLAVYERDFVASSHLNSYKFFVI